MKIWGIIATILMVVFIGTSVYLYVQNKDLKNNKSTAETNLAAANTKMAAANKDMQVLAIFFSGATDTASMTQAHDLITAMNNSTLTADWTAMQNTGSTAAGTQMMKDLISAATNSLK
jgi:hypothetical protein